MPGCKKLREKSRLALSTGLPGIDAGGTLEFRLLSGYARRERHDGVADFIVRCRNRGSATEPE